LRDENRKNRGLSPVSLGVAWGVAIPESAALLPGYAGWAKNRKTVVCPDFLRIFFVIWLQFDQA